MSIRPRLLRASGISLVELVMFIVIIGVAVIAIINVINVTTRHGVDPVRRKQALAIAESLLEEVQMARFTFCDPSDSRAENATSAVVGVDGVGCTSGKLEDAGQESGGVGRPYDNVNDYVRSGYGVPDTSVFNVGGVPAGALSAADGTVMPTGYSAAITITANETLGSISSSATPSGTTVLHIKITVSYSGDSITLDGYRTRYAPTSMP
jgi:MSHA pilin protein MshD